MMNESVLRSLFQPFIPLVPSSPSRFYPLIHQPRLWLLIVYNHYGLFFSFLESFLSFLFNFHYHLIKEIEKEMEAGFMKEEMQKPLLSRILRNSNGFHLTLLVSPS